MLQKCGETCILVIVLVTKLSQYKEGCIDYLEITVIYKQIINLFSTCMSLTLQWDREIIPVSY